MRLNTFIEKLDFLQKQGITQIAIAQACDCHESSISLIAAGKRQRITYDIGTKIDELVEKYENKQNN